MTTDIFSGDVYITLSANGATIHYKGGQPVMDRGLENQAIIALFTTEGWAGNSLFPDPEQKIGSGFINATKQPITLSAINDVEQEAVRALASPAFGNVTVVATNPESDRYEISIRIEPPGHDSSEIILTRNGLNWQAQAFSPAHKQI